MKKILFTFLLLFGALSVFAQSQQTKPTSVHEQYLAEVREKLAMDYSMPDYTIDKIDEKVIGPRLAAILERLNKTYHERGNLDLLNMIQTSQIEGLSYARIKELEFDEVKKIGNVITISYKTSLESNNAGKKKSTLIFNFKDGVSDDELTNQFFCSIGRYIKEDN